jgi:tetratricopeptide (TPR) repeat protein
VARQSEAPDVVEEIESAAERLAGWVAANLWLSVGLLVGVLALAGAVGGYASWKGSREEAASDALDVVRTAYFREMGAAPTALELPELANPKAAQEIQERYLVQFRELAESQRGTVAGTLALLETADILEALGRTDEMAAAIAEARERAPNPVLRAIVDRRLGYLYEDAGRWAEAAAAHAAAAAVPEYPLRSWALADAARCELSAGRRAEALALYERLELEAPDLPLPEHEAAQLRELRATTQP